MTAELRQLPVSAEVTEIQLWSEGKFVGAGAYTNPITEDKLAEATTKIIDNWLLA